MCLCPFFARERLKFLAEASHGTWQDIYHVVPDVPVSVRNKGLRHEEKGKERRKREK